MGGKYTQSIIFKTDALVSQVIQIKENFKSQNETGKMAPLKKKHLRYFIFQEGAMLKYLLWSQLIKYGKMGIREEME